MGTQIVELGLRDEAGTLLRLGQRDPDGPPQLAPFAFGEELAQGRAPVRHENGEAYVVSFMRVRPDGFAPHLRSGLDEKGLSRPA